MLSHFCESAYLKKIDYIRDFFFTLLYILLSPKCNTFLLIPFSNIYFLRLNPFFCHIYTYTRPLINCMRRIIKILIHFKGIKATKSIKQQKMYTFHNQNKANFARSNNLTHFSLACTCASMKLLQESNVPGRSLHL